MQVRYHGFTEEGRLRAPVFLGLRPDVDPKASHASAPAPLREPEPTARATFGSGRVIVTNPDKFLARLRLYQGRFGRVLRQHCRAHVAVPAWPPVGVGSAPRWHCRQEFLPVERAGGDAELDACASTFSDTDEVDRTPKNVFLVDDDDGLVYLANLGCIPLHVLACREQSLGTCDFLTVDFDLGDRPFSDAVRLGLTLREVLDDAGLPGFPKTSGQRGLHVLVPLGDGIPFEAAKLLVELLGRIVTARHRRSHDGAQDRQARRSRLCRHRADRHFAHDRRAVFGSRARGRHGVDATGVGGVARRARFHRVSRLSRSQFEPTKSMIHGNASVRRNPTSATRSPRSSVG